jgi:NHLM bacteriocin system ABC transporter peptidase/ATP-binding protein
MSSLSTSLNPTRPRVKTPTILQMEAVECGAASLAMILAFLGRWVPLERLRSDCGVSRDGSKASNVLRAARAHGLVAKGLKKEIPQLRLMKPPFIIFWNFNHFLVVEGFSAKAIFLNDPAAGRRTVTSEEFDESFTGVVLTFEPGPDFHREGAPPSTIAALRRRMHGTSTPLLFLLIASVIGVIPGMANAAYARVFVDNILLGGMWNWMKPLALVMSATAVLLLALGLLNGWVTLKFQMRMAISESARYFCHTLRLPMDFFAQRYAAEIGSRVSINDTVSTVIATQLTGGVLNLLMVVFYALVMFKYDILLTTIGVTMALCNLAILRYLATRRIDQSRRLLQASGKLMGTSMIGLQSIETIKAGGTESDFFAKWAGYQARVVSMEQELGSSTLMLGSIPLLLTALNSTALLCLGGLRVMDGGLTIGMLITFQALMGSFSAPVGGLMNLGTQFQIMQTQINRLDDVLDNPVDELACATNPEAEILAASSARKLTGRLELRDVVFGYNRLEPPLLPGISLTFAPGQRVALVGGSGSGKSTIARIVAGLHRAWSGDVLFDGRPRSEHGRVVLCNSVACVDQDIALFDGTIRENITMWDESTDDARVVQAAKDACIHDFITSLQGDYDYRVEEGGRNFSGGQRQRLEIARALVTGPSILVLDEATSALDPVTEKTVMDNLRRLGCSCLIVAHRLSTIRDCDEIIVLERGVIQQRGTHEDMLTQPGPYAKLIHVEDRPSEDRAAGAEAA